jgi:hypothetical protein
MAEHNKTNPSILQRFVSSKKAVGDFGETLKKIWKETGISTAARPTYRMDKNYAHHEASVERISKVFLKRDFKKSCQFYYSFTFVQQVLVERHPNLFDNIYPISSKFILWEILELGSS